MTTTRRALSSDDDRYSPRSPDLVGGIVAVATAVAYGGWLAWDQTKDIAPDGSASGPYEPWQVIGLVVTVALIAAVGGWMGRPLVTAFVAATVMGTCFAIDGATDPAEFNDGLWIVGSVFTWFGVLLLVLPVSCAIAALVARQARAQAARVA